MAKGFLHKAAWLVGATLLCMTFAAPARAITISPNSSVDARVIIPGFGPPLLAFAGSDLWAADGSFLYKFSGLDNVPIGSTVSRFTAASYFLGGAGWGALGITYGGAGALYSVGGPGIQRIDLASMTVSTFANSSFSAGAYGIAIDPRDGSIFTSSLSDGKIFRYNPATQNAGLTATQALFFDAGAAGFGGIKDLVILPDGTVAAASYAQNKLLILSGYSDTSPTGSLLGARTMTTGASISAVTYAGGDIYVGFTNGRFSRVDPSGPAYGETLLMNLNDSFINDIAIGPSGALYVGGVSQVSNGTAIFRVTRADGTGIGPVTPVPEPGSWILFATGLAWLLGGRGKTALRRGPPATLAW